MTILINGVPLEKELAIRRAKDMERSVTVLSRLLGDLGLVGDDTLDVIDFEMALLTKMFTGAGISVSVDVDFKL